MSAALAIAALEMRRLLRARAALGLLLVLPILQIVLFGLAIRPQPDHLAVAIAAPTAAQADAVAAHLRGIPRLDIVATRIGAGGAERAVRRGEATIGIEFGRPPRIVVDSAEPIAVAGAAAEIEATFWRNVADEAALDPTPAPVVVRLFNPQDRADWSFLPALAGVTVMIAMVMLGCLSVTRERETGSWETLMTLPVGAGSIVLGKLLPHMLLGTVQGAIVLAVAIAAFGVPTAGPVAAVLVLLPPLAAAHFLIGHALAARARTQLAGLQGAVGFYLPAMLLSGFLYPFASLPGWAQGVGRLLPLSHFIAVARDVLLRGQGWATAAAGFWPIVLAAGGAGIAAVAATSRRGAIL